METSTIESPELINQHYTFAANIILRQNKTGDEAKNALIEKGVSADVAAMIVDKLEIQISDARQNVIHEKAKKDMLYGALWCIVGTALTLANVGFIFWGAILFGGVQFFRGLININS